MTGGVCRLPEHVLHCVSRPLGYKKWAQLNSLQLPGGEEGGGSDGNFDVMSLITGESI